MTSRNGTEVSRRLLEKRITTAPVDQVTSVGTREAAPPPEQVEPASNCDANYTGACVPVDSDVDCEGGSGNGPSYVSGPVTVVGDDVYDLDRDSDGVGCEV